MKRYIMRFGYIQSNCMDKHPNGTLIELEEGEQVINVEELLQEMVLSRISGEAMAHLIWYLNDKSFLPEQKAKEVIE